MLIADTIPKKVPTSRELREARRKQRELFKRGQQAERSYIGQLRAIAKQVGQIVRGFAPDGIVEDMMTLRHSLEKYADLLRPWAVSVGRRMLAEVSRKDASAWATQGKIIGRALHREIMTAPTGEVMKELLAEQVDLITSIPRKAAERVHELTIEGIQNSTRADQIAAEIRRSGKVSEFNAIRIARTGVTTTATALLEARCLHIGSQEYIWRTSRDSDVRPTHRILEGKTFHWNDPPIAGENGFRAHPGQSAFCRCWPEPVIPDVL